MFLQLSMQLHRECQDCDRRQEKHTEELFTVAVWATQTPAHFRGYSGLVHIEFLSEELFHDFNHTSVKNPS